MLNNRQTIASSFREDRLRDTALAIIKLVTASDYIDKPGMKYADLEPGTWRFYHDNFLKVMGNEFSFSEVAKKIIQIFRTHCAGDEKKFEACINQRGYLGQTLLHFFAVTQNKEAIEKLLNAGANINQKDLWRNTPLHLLLGVNDKRFAITEPSIELIELLLSYNAEFNVLNMHDYTFLDLLIDDQNLIPTPGYKNKTNDQALKIAAYLFTHANLIRSITIFKVVLDNADEIRNFEKFLNDYRTEKAHEEMRERLSF